MEFRRANTDDINVLINLRKQQLLDEGSKAEQEIDKELGKYFSQNIANNTFISWVATENNEIIATSGVCFYQLPPNYSNPSGKVAYITNMYTKKEFRRKGIASKLLKKIIDEVRSLNYRIIRLHASVDGKNLYLKHGFSDYEGYMHLRI
ncbi:MAG: GNAT family N-acetyltransferase [Treponema sp.]|nr:GNAT family N-acetyltransferase [Treponema sp.]